MGDSPLSSDEIQSLGDLLFVSSLKILHRKNFQLGSNDLFRFQNWPLLPAGSTRNFRVKDMWYRLLARSPPICALLRLKEF